MYKAAALELVWVLTELFPSSEFAKHVPPSELVLICWGYSVVKDFHSEFVVAVVARESFQIQMVLSFTFLCANDLRTSLLITRICTFFLSCTYAGTYSALVFIWYKNIFHIIALLILFHAAKAEKRI